MIVAKEIRRVHGGYIVEVRWPYASGYGSVVGFGEVVCKTWEEVLTLLDRTRCEGNAMCDCQRCVKGRGPHG